MKLVEILAKELAEWPTVDSVIPAYIVQEGDKELFSTTVKPRFGGNVAWHLSERDRNADCGYFKKHCAELASDYRTAIVTRADWEAEKMKQAKPAEQENKWIRHRGGKCPVEAGAKVEVRRRSGAIEKIVELDINNVDETWLHVGDKDDIMAYRLRRPKHQPVSPDIYADDTGPSNEPVNAEYVEPKAAYKADDYAGLFTAPAHMMLGYASKEAMFEAVGCETMEDVMAKMQNDVSAVIVPGKIDQIDGPIKWRDRIREIGTTVDSLEEERTSLIQRLEDEGFKLVRVDAKVSPKQDMTDCLNWKRGDVVMSIGDSSGFRKGGLYLLREDCTNRDHSIKIAQDDNGKENGWADRFFVWHSRP